MNLKIQKIFLKNFMGFEEETFDFSEILTVVIGPNGSGKSALLEALALSFQLKERGNSVSAYIYEGQDEATIKLDCIWMDKPLSITSVFSEKGSRKTSRVITYGGESYKDTVANNFLTEHFNPRSLSMAFALQGNEKFLTTSKADNYKKFSDLLQVDFAKEIKSTKERLKGIEAEKTTSLESLHKNSGSLSFVETQLKDIQEKLNNFQDIDPIDENLLTSLEKDFTDKGFEIKKIESELAESSGLTQSFQEVESSIVRDEASLHKYENDLEALSIPEKKDSAPVSEKIATQKTTIERLLTCNKELLQNRGTLSATLSVEMTRKQQIQNGICPTCLQPISEHSLQSTDDKIKELQTQLQDTEAQLAKNEQDSKDAEKELSTLKDLLQEIELNNNKITYALKTKEALTQNIKTLEDKISQSKSRRDELQQKIDSTEKNLDGYKKIEALTKERAQLNEQIETLRRNKNQREINISTKATLQTSLKDLETKKVELSQEKEKLEKDIHLIEFKIGQLQKLQQAFTDLPKLYTKGVMSKIETSMCSTAKAFGFKGLSIEFDDKGIDFYLEKYKNNSTLTVPYRMCSSFQKNLINISCINALSKLFEIPFVCIDELDSNADVKNTLKMSLMYSILSSRVPVVAVTHSESLSSDLIQKVRGVSIIKMKGDLIKEDDDNDSGEDSYEEY